MRPATNRGATCGSKSFLQSFSTIIVTGEAMERRIIPAEPARAFCGCVPAARSSLTTMLECGAVHGRGTSEKTLHRRRVPAHGASRHPVRGRPPRAHRQIGRAHV